MKVLQLEHAGLFTGPNILCFPHGRAAAAIRRFAGAMKQLKCRNITRLSLEPGSHLAV